MKINLTILFSLFYFVLSIPVQAQMASVSGYVTNHLNGTTIKNATVLESNSGIGTITNNDGYYRLVLAPKQQKLEISCPGYNSVEITFRHFSDTIIKVELIPLNLPDNIPLNRNELQTEVNEQIFISTEPDEENK